VSAWARRQAGRDPRRVLPVRRRAAYAAIRFAANDNDAAPPLGRGFWLPPAALILLALALAFA
jgi:hypothetical protein